MSGLPVAITSSSSGWGSVKVWTDKNPPPSDVAAAFERQGRAVARARRSEQFMDPATVLAIIAIIDSATRMLAQHANGQQPTADDLTALQQQTKQLSDQIDALRTDKA
jgi:hypothetical protein